MAEYESAQTTDRDQVYARRDAARHALLGQTGAMGYASGGERRFTRDQVLTVLSARKALLSDQPHFNGASRELDTLKDIFARME